MVVHRTSTTVLGVILIAGFLDFSYSGKPWESDCVVAQFMIVSIPGPCFQVAMAANKMTLAFNWKLLFIIHALLGWLALPRFRFPRTGFPWTLGMGSTL